MAFSGWIATTAGWYTTEIGRQPYLVYGVLTTAQAAATNVTAGMIGVTLAMYLTLYAVLIAAFISVVFYLARKASVKIDPLSEQAFSSIGVEKMVEGKL
jgi:cytochrome d ubiquinol oxidase subunit I